jgi:hypothetical protein
MNDDLDPFGPSAEERALHAAGGPAFPQPATSEGYATNTLPGMTLRDWFAGQALAGMIAQGDAIRTTYSSSAAEAYRYADAMLREREP